MLRRVTWIDTTPRTMKYLAKIQAATFLQFQHGDDWPGAAGGGHKQLITSCRSAADNDSWQLGLGLTAAGIWPPLFTAGLLKLIIYTKMSNWPPLLKHLLLHSWNTWLIPALYHERCWDVWTFLMLTEFMIDNICKLFRGNLYSFRREIGDSTTSLNVQKKRGEAEEIWRWDCVWDNNWKDLLINITVDAFSDNLCQDSSLTQETADT